MKPCCEKDSAGIVCEHLRDALLVGIEKMKRDGVPFAEACRRVAAALLIPTVPPSKEGT